MTDRARLERALIAADKAGDTQAARKIAAALRAAPAQSQGPAVEPQVPQPDTQPVGDAADLIMGPLRSMGSAAIAAPIAGIAGIDTFLAKQAGGLANRLPPGLMSAGLSAAGNWAKDKDPADVVRGVQRAMTYQPRTKVEQAASGLAALPFEKYAQGADWVGEQAREAGASPGVATLINTGIQAAPAAMSPMLRRGKVAQQTPRPAPQAAAAQTLTPEIRAQEYARTIGLDWSSLSREIQGTLTSIAGDSKQLAKLDPAAVQRQAQLQSLPVPVPATRGQVTRDPVQLRNEGNVSATNAGKPIRETYLDQNQALLDNLEVLKGRVSNRSNAAQTPEAVGISVQDQALRAKLDLAKKGVTKKYADAEAAGELQGKVSPARLIQTIRNTPDTTHFGWVESWLNKMEVIKKTESGTVTRKLTLKEMEDLRQAAVARAMDGGTEGYYAGKVISAIDQATEGGGGKLYKEARAARKAQALEFEETGAVARLVENKSRTDRATALEDTWRKTVVGGSIQDLRNVKRSLLTGGDAKTRSAGKRAWRDIKAQTIQQIKDEATKSVALNERGTPNVTPAAMKRAIDSIGKDKLDEIFGSGTAQRLDRILEATRTVKTVPPPGHAGSSTMSNVLSFLEKGLTSTAARVLTVGSGDLVAGAIRGGKSLKAGADTRNILRESQKMPLDNALMESRRNALRDF